MKIKVGSYKFWITLGVIVIIFLPPFAKYQELCYKNRRLAERINTLKEENRKLEDEKRKLETDIVYVEKRAREKIGLVRKGEIVMKQRQK